MVSGGYIQDIKNLKLCLNPYSDGRWFLVVAAQFGNEFKKES